MSDEEADADEVFREVYRHERNKTEETYEEDVEEITWKLSKLGPIISIE